MNAFSITVLVEEEIDAATDAALRQFLSENFPHWREIFAVRRQWHQTPPIFTLIAYDDNHGDNKNIIGHVAVVERKITTTWNWRYRVASIQGVCVAVEYRHHGLGKRLLEATLAEARRREFPFAILYCHETLVTYYESLGWKLADDSMIMRNSEDLPIAMQTNCPMYKELTAEKFPEGPMDIYSTDQIQSQNNSNSLGNLIW